MSPGGEGYSGLVSFDLPLPFEPAAAATARRELGGWLNQVGLSPLVDDATLVVSELIANAVRHAVPPLALHAIRMPAGVRLEVSDGAHDAMRPRTRTPDVGDPSGRGLGIVSALTQDWGVRADPHGKTVWADLPIGQPTPAESGLISPKSRQRGH